MEKNAGKEARVAVKRILVPVDNSGYKDKIIAYAISLAKAWGAEIIVVHVIDPGLGIPGGRIKEQEQGIDRSQERC